MEGICIYHTPVSIYTLVFYRVDDLGRRGKQALLLTEPVISQETPSPSFIYEWVPECRYHTHHSSSLRSSGSMRRSSISARRRWSAPSINTVTSLHLDWRNAVSSGHKVWVPPLMWLEAGAALTLGLVRPITVAQRPYSINIRDKYSYERQHFNSTLFMLAFFCKF